MCPGSREASVSPLTDRANCPGAHHPHLSFGLKDMSWPDDLLRAWRSDQRRWLLVASCCSPDPSLSGASWQELRALFADDEALLGWLTSGPPRRALPLLGTRADHLELNDSVRQACADATAEAWALNESVFVTARSVVGTLARADVDVMALKGLALVGEVYHPHRLRAVGDLDLLVRPGDHRRAVEVLEAGGWSREPGDPLPRPGTAAVMLVRQGSAFIDIHGRPARNLPFRVGQDPACWLDAGVVGDNHPMAGSPLLRPSMESMLVIQASHAVLGANKDLVHPLLDISQLLTVAATSRSAPLDPDRLLAVADANGARGRLRAVLKLLVGELGVPGPVEVPPESRRARRREEKIHRADRRVSNQGGGALSSLGRALGYVRIGTVGQGPATVMRMSLSIVASKVDRRQHPVPVVPIRSDHSKPNPEIVMGSIFGMAEDDDLLEIRWSDPTMVKHIKEVWPPLGLTSSDALAPREPRMLICLTGDARSPMVTIDGEPRSDGWEAVESALALFAAERLSHWIAVHAAVFVWNGKAVIVPGASHAGKSTLAAAAHEAGAIVASDEYALIDPLTGYVRGWRRPVRLRTAEGIEKLDIAQDIKHGPVAIVAAVRYSPEEPATRTMTQAETALALLANIVCAQSRPAESLRAAVCVTRSARGLTGTRRETEAFLQKVASSL